MKGNFITVFQRFFHSSLFLSVETHSLSSDRTCLSTRHLQDQRNALNIPSSSNSPTGPKARKAFKKLANRATTKVIDRHLHLSETQAVSAQSPPQKRMMRVSAQRAAMKTAEYVTKLFLPIQLSLGHFFSVTFVVWESSTPRSTPKPGTTILSAKR